MAAFEYIALDHQGKQHKGTLEADSGRQVRQMLRDKQWTPLSVNTLADRKQQGEEGRSFFLRRGISAVELATVTRQLATLIQAAMPIEEALNGVAAQQEKRRIKNMLLAVRSRVLEGYTLAKSLEAFPEVFPQMYRATVAAGEHAGYLDRVLNRLADYTEARMRSGQKIQQALVYPIILMLASIGIVSFLLGFVVPDVIKVFLDSGQELPLITELLINASEGFQAWWPVIFGVIVAAIVVVRHLLKKASIRLSWHRVQLTLPLVGRFIRTANAARFASTLSMLTRSGVSLVEALMIAAQVVNNDAIKHAVQDVARRVSEGTSLNRALAETGYFPPLMLHMIASGEATGELDQMLERTAQNQQMELEGRITVMLGLFEPLMLVLMGGVVMMIVLAILLPILNMNQLLN
ncbi:type II secretion system inner membrane protein GspF [Endozoicomonas sp. GU-1]|uniref:type II secretion system inner membrane protein GspF n=1 Tax=Endozoicomonas sp. GU-1 TaxID=3009078 RepID=UPI0022B53844|nr:type II secretion system inner membrane protein GspF [Endozoicomonas sp. GU-1]WBA80004.1 type II secretion system inner membrane protein GspF [Endozoicomonas sp. GU-1]WBA87578.1 type II secretion system inner membrane protein GspF [Endozoicomonas sp. GU-1]